MPIPPLHIGAAECQCGQDRPRERIPVVRAHGTVGDVRADEARDLPAIGVARTTLRPHGRLRRWMREHPRRVVVLVHRLMRREWRRLDRATVSLEDVADRRGDRAMAVP